MSSPLDAVLPHLPRWLEPHARVLQPHLDAAMRLIVACLDAAAQQVAPLLHQLTDAAAPYLQVGSRVSFRARGVHASQFRH